MLPALPSKPLTISVHSRTLTEDRSFNFCVNQDTVMGKVIDYLEEHFQAQGCLRCGCKVVNDHDRVRSLQLKQGDELYWRDIVQGTD